MRNFTIILLAIFTFLLSCKQKEKQKDTFILKYIKNNNEIVLCFENNTSENIIFLLPNSLEFSDKNYKSFSTRGAHPINVYALLQPNQSSLLYQKKYDSIVNKFYTEKGITDFFKEMKPEDGNSVFYLKEQSKIEVKYDLTVKSMMGMMKKSYSSKFKQNYYPYEKVLKGSTPDGEYVRRFSKLNFGKVKFVAQPVIEDSLFLKLSEKDVTP